MANIEARLEILEARLDKIERQLGETLEEASRSNKKGRSEAFLYSHHKAFEYVDGNKAE